MRARGGQLYVFADEQAGFTDSDSVTVQRSSERITPAGTEFCSTNDGACNSHREPAAALYSMRPR
jgi:hypothetical protein